VRIRFLADENLRRAIVLGVRRREPAISFAQAFEVEAAGQDDSTVLRIAAQQGRILVSQDVRTMPQYFYEFTQRETSPGRILIPQKLALSVAIDELVLLWIASDDREWVNRICYLPL